MTDINASLKKTINDEPGPQYKEKGKAEFNFAEGEDGVPYSYDKKVESRLTAIENKLDSVIENGSVNTQLTGSNLEDEDSLPTRSQKSDILTFLDSVTVQPGSHTGRVTIPILGAKKAIMLINSSQEFKIIGTELWGSAQQWKHAYPRRDTSENSTLSLNYPRNQVLGYNIAEWAENEEDALRRSMLFDKMEVMVYNLGDEPAVVSLRLMRLWGVEI